MICPHYILTRAEIQAATLALGRIARVALALPAGVFIAAVHAPLMLASATYDCFTAVLLMPIVAPLAVIGLSLLAAFRAFQFIVHSIQNIWPRIELPSPAVAPSTPLVPMPARSQIPCNAESQAINPSRSTSAQAPAALSHSMSFASAAASTLATNSSLIQTPVDDVAMPVPAAHSYETALPQVVGDNVQSIELLIDGLRSASANNLHENCTHPDHMRRDGAALLT